MKLSDRVATWFGGLSSREQRLLGILGVISALFVVFLFGYTVYSSYSAINTRIARAEELAAILDANKEALLSCRETTEPSCDTIREFHCGSLWAGGLDVEGEVVALLPVTRGDLFDAAGLHLFEALKAL